MKNSELNSIYFHCVIEFYDKENDKTITIKDIEFMCECLPNIKYYAFILHNNDLGKRPHYHINLIFGNNGYVSSKVLYQIARILNINVNCIGIKCTSSTGLYNYFRYLVHLDDEEKYHYNINEIYSNCPGIVNDCLSGINPFDVDISRIIYLCKICKTKAELFSKLGLKYSNHYYKVINDLWLLKDTYE